MAGIDEVFISRINKLISEEYGINDAMNKEAGRATRSIIANITGKEFIRDEVSGVFKRSHTETVTIGNKSVKVYVTNYWFENEKDYNDFRRKSIIPLGFSYEVRMIFLPLFSIGDISFDEEDASDTIYHEIEHFFQTTKMGHNFGSEQLYAIASKNITSEDKIRRALADIIYVSSQSEQDAMINGMYGSLKGCSLIEIHKKIRESEAAIWCKRLYKDYRMLKTCDDSDLDAALGEYGKTKKWFLRVASKGIRRFEEKIARTSFKLIKDAQMRDGFRSEPKLNEDKNISGQMFWLTREFDWILEDFRNG